MPKSTKSKFPSSGYIVKGREVIGDFAYSFISCSFSYGIYRDGPSHHYYSEAQLKEEAERNGWKLVSPAEVRTTKTYIGR